MFNNPETLWIEIIAIILIISFLAAIIGSYIYKKIHHIPTGDCANCHKNKEQLLKEYHQCFCGKNDKRTSK